MKQVIPKGLSKMCKDLQIGRLNRMKQTTALQRRKLFLICVYIYIYIYNADERIFHLRLNQYECFELRHSNVSCLLVKKKRFT